MIEPCGAIIQSMLCEFGELGLAIERDTDYVTHLANGDCAPIIATERSSQPAVLASFVDRAGSTFEIGLAQRILAGPEFKSLAREPDEIVGSPLLGTACAGAHVRVRRRRTVPCRIPSQGTGVTERAWPVSLSAGDVRSREQQSVPCPITGSRFRGQRGLYAEQ